MRPVSQALVKEVWREVTGYPPERAEAEARRFAASQPHVADLCARATGAFGDHAEKLALGLAFLLVKVLEASAGLPFPTVSRQRIIEACGATSAWLAEWQGVQARIFLENVEAGGRSRRPTLIQHLLGLHGDGPERVAQDAEVAATLFVLLKTLSGALDAGQVAEAPLAER